MREALEGIIIKAFAALSVANPPKIEIEFPSDFNHGDYSTNVVLKIFGPILHGNRITPTRTGSSTTYQWRPILDKYKTPKELAEKLVEKMNDIKDNSIEKIDIAGNGFINFYFNKKYFADLVESIDEHFGKNQELFGKKVMVEYTDPNPFKEFHIGHLMTNTIGESLARIAEWSGGETKRANYQGDVGLHVAKAVWGMKVLWKDGERFANAGAPQKLGVAYATGAGAYDANKDEINEINKKIYERSDEEINMLYDLGRKISLDYFETIYSRLGTKFDLYFFESEVGGSGKKLVEENVGKVFEKSDGAIIFPGEKFGLHSRVFINSLGLPTYEAKELGLAKTKFEKFPYDISLVVTGNEVREYFKVLLKAIEMIFPELAPKIRHIPHGMLRLPTGKMSSRTGDVITAEWLIQEAENRVKQKVDESDAIPADEKTGVLGDIAVGAIKYSILRQAAGRDIVFDFDTSLSFEGNSGPYLQYTYARARSVLRKAEEAGIVPDTAKGAGEPNEVERMLVRFPEIVKRALSEYEPHHIATYLHELAQIFNNYYGKEKIVSEAADAPYKVALTRALAHTMKNGLHLLGIKAPERM